MKKEEKPKNIEILILEINDTLIISPIYFNRNLRHQDVVKKILKCENFIVRFNVSQKNHFAAYSGDFCVFVINEDPSHQHPLVLTLSNAKTWINRIKKGVKELNKIELEKDYIFFEPPKIKGIRVS